MSNTKPIVRNPDGNIFFILGACNKDEFLPADTPGESDEDESDEDEDEEDYADDTTGTEDDDIHLA